MQNKYVVLKREDAQRYLTLEQKQQLLDIQQTIAAGRQNSGKSVHDIFFVLNMKDVYAGSALDAYILAIQTDGTYESNAAVREAMEVAIRVKQTAALAVSPRLPD